MSSTEPRTYTLWQITGVMGEALALAKSVHAGSPDRALDVYGQEIIDRLKALPLDAASAPGEPEQQPVMGEEAARALVYMHTHDADGNVLTWAKFVEHNPGAPARIRKKPTVQKMLEEVMGPMP